MININSKPGLVVVNPGHGGAYGELAATLTAKEPPVWAAMIAGYARLKGIGVEVIDAEAEGLTPVQVAAAVASMDPTLVAVMVYGHQPSASTQTMPSAGAVCWAIDQMDPGVPTILVGGHVAALPERTMREEACAYVATGEGPVTIVELVRCLEGEGDVADVPGLLYRCDGRIERTRAAPLVRELDEEMPGPAWDLLPMGSYRAHNWHTLGLPEGSRGPYASLYTTLGCPYRCTFCCIQAPFKDGEALLKMPAEVNSYRQWGPEAVVGWIDTLVDRYGVRNIKIADEMFVLNRKHVEGICGLLIERGYDLNIWAYARVDTVKDGMADKLRRAGFRWLAFGVEAGNAEVRDGVQKGFSQELIYKTVEDVRAAGINIIGNYIFGLPGDDVESMRDTLDMALYLNCEWANFYSAMAYPGSVLYDQAVKEGKPLPGNWSGYSQHSPDCFPLGTAHLSPDEVVAFRDGAFQTYFGSGRYLDMVQRKFGAEAVQHIREMASQPLRRDGSLMGLQAVR